MHILTGQVNAITLVMRKSKTFKKQREKMLERINTEQGILLRTNHSIQVEGTFGVLKEDMGFRRFLTRGTTNVRTGIFVLCFVCFGTYFLRCLFILTKLVITCLCFQIFQENMSKIKLKHKFKNYIILIKKKIEK